MNPELERDQRARVVAIAKTWAFPPTPYHHRARLKGIGVDCGQLIAAVFEEAGLIPAVPLDNYPPDWMLHRSEPRFQNTVERYTRQVDRDIRPADILLFQIGRSYSHGAIVLEYPLILHALINVGKVTISSMEQEAELRARLGGVWTLREWS
jgi:cell wall-associated NlpC family hydrolase